MVNRGQYQKGHKQFNTGKTWFKKGYKISEETKRKQKLYRLKFPQKLSDKHKRKLLLSRPKSPTLGKHWKVSEEKIKRGDKSKSWKGGKTEISKIIRMSMEYRLWRKSVFERDNYNCIWCGRKGGKLNADHIKPFSLFPELRFAIDNGRTLCHECHKKTDSYGWKILKLKK